MDPMPHEMRLSMHSTLHGWASKQGGKRADGWASGQEDAQAGRLRQAGR